MPDPQLPDFYRAQWIWHGTTGLPEDVYVNSFVFRNDGTGNSADVAQAITNALFAFWCTPVAPSTATPWQYVNQSVVDHASVKVYDLGQLPPRNPIIETVDKTTLSAGGTQVGSLGLPYEVAVCLSWRTATRTPRGRGRNYLGPLTVGVINESAAGGNIVLQAYRDLVVAHANRLMSANGQNVSLHVLSQADLQARLVIGGYVDNAFDTQRRRGLAPSVRTTFGTVL